MKIEQVNILGIGVSALNMKLAIDQISNWIADRQPHYVCVTPAHSLMDGYQDPGLRKIFNASGMNTPDGMAIVWLLKLNGHKLVERVYGPDLMMNVCKFSIEKGWRHFFYGGAPGVAQELSKNLTAQYPGLQVVGVFSPPFRELTEEEDRKVAELIRMSNPNIIWVGISSPKQERWMSRHITQYDVPVMIGVGAAFDFLSGRKKQAPRWIQRSGFEWLFRFISEPRRLWRRYIKYPWFVILVCLQLLNIIKFPISEVGLVNHRSSIDDESA